MISWLGVLKTLLWLADKIAGIVQFEQAAAAGEDRVIARQLAAMADRLKIGDLVEAEIDAMSPSEIDDALRGDAR